MVQVLLFGSLKKKKKFLGRKKKCSWIQRSPMLN